MERGNGIPKEVEVDKRREVVFEERAMLRVSDMLDILRFLWSPYNDGFTISGNLKSFEGAVLNCRGGRTHGEFYLNELVIHEIRNNASATFQNFLFDCCKIEFSGSWKSNF